MSEAWEHYRHLTPRYEAPLCLHQLGLARVKVAAELLALTAVDCVEAMPQDTCRALQSALAVVVRL